MNAAMRVSRHTTSLTFYLRKDTDGMHGALHPTQQQQLNVKINGNWIFCTENVCFSLGNGLMAYTVRSFCIFLRFLFVWLLLVLALKHTHQPLHWFFPSRENRKKPNSSLNSTWEWIFVTWVLMDVDDIMQLAHRTEKYTNNFAKKSVKIQSLIRINAMPPVMVVVRVQRLSHSEVVLFNDICDEQQ